MRTPRFVKLAALATCILVTGASTGLSAASWSPAVAGEVASQPNSTIPLRFVRASYEVDVLGVVAMGVIEQEFVYDGEEPLSATYVAPRPPRLRLTGFEIEVDGEPVEAPPKLEKKPRSKSPQRRQARNSTPAALRSASFPVEPGQQVLVRTGFEVTLPLDDGHFELRLPAIGGMADGAATRTPRPVPWLATIRLHHEIVEADSPSHDVFLGYEGDLTRVDFANGETEDGQEFVLRFAVGSETDPTVLAYVGDERDDKRDVMLIVTPPVTPNREDVRPKQVMFVLDTSGSMAKGKLEQAREALKQCLDRLSPTDQYNITRFSGDFSLLRPEPTTVGDLPMASVKSWLDSLRPGGNTQLLPALGATFEQPDHGEHHRMVIVLTDGNVQNVPDVMEFVQAGLGEARLFVVGIGEDVRHETVVRLAEFGRGEAVFLDDPAALEDAMSRLFSSVADPLAWDLNIDWGGASVESMTPTRLPDLYGGRAVKVRATIQGELPEQIHVRGSTMEGPRTFSSVVPDESSSGMPRIPRSGVKRRASGSGR